MYDEVVERFLFFSLHNIRLGLALRTPASCQALWMVAFFHAVTTFVLGSFVSSYCLILDFSFCLKRLNNAQDDEWNE
jgi:hypothetical protein